MARRLVLALALAGAVVVPGCKKQESAPAAGTAVKPATRAKVALPVLLDGKPVASEVELGEAPRPLTELVAGAPAFEAWIAIELMEAAGPARAVMRPAEFRPGKIPALTTGPAAGVLFGWVTPGGTALEEAVAITQVKVMTKAEPATDDAKGTTTEHGSGAGGGDGERPTPTAEMKIPIETPKGPLTFTGDKLVGLPSVTAPVGDTETPGWNLVDVMKAAGIGDAKALVLTDTEGASLKIVGDDFDPAKTFLYLKLNKSGVFRFRVFRKQGDTWEMAGDLRGIKLIKVLP